MTNEERKAIENLSPEEQEVLLKKLEDGRRVKNLAARGGRGFFQAAFR